MGPVMAPAPPFRIRPGRYADIAPGAAIFARTIGQDALMDRMLPARNEQPEAFQEWVERLWRERLWTLGWRFDVVVLGDEVVGLSWWNRGAEREGFWKRWLSPTWWFAPVVRFCRTVYASLRPLPRLTGVPTDDFSPLSSQTFTAVLTRLKPRFLTTERRRTAWYLSTLAVAPAYQGFGLGHKLLQHGLDKVDREEGRAAWLVRLKGTQRFYEGHGFREVGTMAVDELEGWDGGQVMFRE